jgi:hypothetical protein
MEKEKKLKKKKIGKDLPARSPAPIQGSAQPTIETSPSHHTVSVVFNLRSTSSCVAARMTPDPPPILRRPG